MKKITKSKKKLVLATTSVRALQTNLTDAQLRAVAGGEPGISRVGVC